MSQALPTSGICCYQGEWKSDVFPWLVAHGTVAAEVNFSTKSADILLKYDGVYKNRSVDKFACVLQEKKNDSKSAVSKGAFEFAVKMADGGKPSFQFSATNITKDEIIGNYRSLSPKDKGNFHMKRITADAFKIIIQESTQCTLQ